MNPATETPDRRPWPHEWARGRALAVTGFLVFGFFSFVALATGIDEFRGGFDLRTAVPSMFLPLCVSFAGWAFVGGVRRRHRSTAPLRVSTPAESRVPGLAIPYSRSYATWVGALVVSSAGASLPLGVHAAARLSEGAPVNGALFGILAGTLLVACGAFVVEILRKHIVRGVFILTPDGIVHHSWASDLNCPWDAVRSVQAVALPAAAIRVVTTAIAGETGRALVERTPMLRSLEARYRPDLIVGAPFLSIDAALVLETMRFYAANPLLRHELGTQAAIDRVRRGDVLPSGRNAGCCDTTDAGRLVATSDFMGSAKRSKASAADQDQREMRSLLSSRWRLRS